MDPSSEWVINILIFMCLPLAFLGFLLIHSFKTVRSGEVMVRYGWGGIKVFFDYAMVFPIIHYRDILDLTPKRLEIQRSETNPLELKDGTKAKLQIFFILQLKKSQPEVLHAAKFIGAPQTFSGIALQEIFRDVLNSSLKTVAGNFTYGELFHQRETFRHELKHILSATIDGYEIHQIGIDYLEPLPEPHCPFPENEQPFRRRAITAIPELKT